MKAFVLFFFLFGLVIGDLAIGDPTPTPSPLPSPDYYKPIRRKMPIKKRMPSPRPIPSPVGKVPLLVVPTPNPSPDSDE